MFGQQKIFVILIINVFYLPTLIFSPFLFIFKIENFAGSDDQYSCRITHQVVPCISQLAVAFREDSSWKALNYQVCLKTKNKSPKV